ncbi:MAG: LysR family transcriptional regulator [Clostridia bacterium]|nr:LysR family transcriptional regulator [Clostridia bacterium]MBQ4618829.1 LysR family transcriptional regulator [Clostridia bacterium]MBQ6716234.1 LysR family transcriptional regulator [Clostridia bacterium]
MNILHMKYAVEVAKAGSLSKASETLLIAQPNISRSIKELESDLGITIFERSAKGMFLTHDGEVFMNYAKSIISQIEAVEKFYKESTPDKLRFSISVPRASYISEAFAQFSKRINSSSCEVFYNETNSRRAIENILSNDYGLGIIRYAANHDESFKTMLEEKGLNYELVTQFTYQLIMSKSHPLAERESISLNDLKDYIEIAHADPYVPSLTLSKVLKEEQATGGDRKIYVFERASQFELLSENNETFMWISPVPTKMLERYNLIQRPCAENERLYKDMLIYRNGYTLSPLDKEFITILIQTRRQYL